MTVLTPYRGEVDELMITILFSFTFLKYTRDDSDFTNIHTYICIYIHSLT